MKDKEFLQWIHTRLVIAYGDNPNLDHMHKLQNIINDYDEDKITPNIIMQKKETNNDQ